MDEDKDIFPDLSLINSLKTYTKRPKKMAKNAKDNSGKAQPLTTKIAVKYLLEGRLKSKVCRYCLNVTSGLAELDQVMSIAGTGNMYKVTIRDIIASFHPFKVTEDPNFPNKICQKCVDRALGAYLFTQQCERSERAMLNCFDDIYEKFEKLDPIDRPKKRGRQKLNPNHNVLHAEHENVIDYAEPIINIINVGAETATKEPELNEFECKKCCQVLPNLESLMNHEKIHPKTMWYHCRLCGKSFPKPNQLKRHHHRVHVLGKEVQTQINKNFKCKECDHITENFIQHLQHVEKHKFKNVMKHLIEKRMDNLCAVCFNKGTNMKDLDKMVCIHGGHPDVMGDKTLYSLLASTLPNPKSYKYQELFIPSKAHIMIMSKKQSTSDEQIIKRKKSLAHSYNSKEEFAFSYPLVVSERPFRTDHFYGYVFSNVQYDNSPKEDENMMQHDDITYAKVNAVLELKHLDNGCKRKYSEFNQSKIEKLIINLKTTVKGTSEINSDKVIEKCDNVTDEKAIAVVETESCENTEIRLEKIKMTIEKLNAAVRADRKIDMEITEIPQNTPYSFNFSNPTIVCSDNNHKDINENEITDKQPDIRDICISGNQSNETSKTFVELDENGVKMETAETDADKRLAKDLHDNKHWIFTKVDDGDAETHKLNKTLLIGENKDECNYCWLFQNLKQCDYCKKDFIIKNIEDKIQIDDSKNIEVVKEDIEKTWQCNVCLVNNKADRITCHCCGTTRYIEHSDMKIAFGNNNVFFEAKSHENLYLPKTISEAKDQENSKVIESVMVNENLMDPEVESLMDFRSSSEDNVQSMDIETNTFCINTNEKGLEQMEVEENVIILDWNKPSILNVSNIQDPTNIKPNIAPNLEFSIGCATQSRSFNRKFKRAVRNVPKAFK